MSDGAPGWDHDYDVVVVGSGNGALTSAIVARDFPHVQAAVVLVALIFVTVNLIIDLIYRRIDPRIGERDA